MGAIYQLCRKVYNEIKNNDNIEVLGYLRDIVRNKDYTPSNPEEICNKILYTSYLASAYSGDTTTNRAKEIAAKIGSNHQSLKMNDILDSFTEFVIQYLQFTPKFKSQGGHWQEDL